jgi:hypothetical protein
VARLMQEQQLSARKKKRKPRTTDSHHDFPVAPNLLEQDFTADARIPSIIEGSDKHEVTIDTLRILKV